MVYHMRNPNPCLRSIEKSIVKFFIYVTFLSGTLLAGKIKGVAFDLEGTLVDTVDLHVEAWIKTFKSNGFSVEPKKLKPLIGMASPKIIRNFVGNINDQLLEKIDFEYKQNFEKTVDSARSFTETKDALKSLHDANIKLAVASSTGAKVVDLILEKTGIYEFVDASVGGDEVLLGKPDPAIYLEAFKRIEVTPRMGAVVGDTEFDAIPARKIGALAIIVRRDDTEVASAELIFQNLLEAAAEILSA